jgi:hypothetical protein
MFSGTKSLERKDLVERSTHCSILVWPVRRSYCKQWLPVTRRVLAILAVEDSSVVTCLTCILKMALSSLGGGTDQMVWSRFSSCCESRQEGKTVLSFLLLSYDVTCLAVMVRRLINRGLISRVIFAPMLWRACMSAPLQLLKSHTGHHENRQGKPFHEYY